MRPKGSPKIGGRAKGTPNKASTEFRQTVTALLEGNAQNVSQWLSEVAIGKQAIDKDGNPRFDAHGEPVMLLKPDPGRALDLMAKLAEFAAPKLARVEHTGDPNAPIQTLNRIELVALDGNPTDSSTS
jgi:hypothetical protein